MPLSSKNATSGVLLSILVSIIFLSASLTTFALISAGVGVILLIVKCVFDQKEDSFYERIFAAANSDTLPPLLHATSKRPSAGTIMVDTKISEVDSVQKSMVKNPFREGSIGHANWTSAERVAADLERVLLNLPVQSAIDYTRISNFFSHVHTLPLSTKLSRLDEEELLLVLFASGKVPPSDLIRYCLPFSKYSRTKT